MHAALVPRGSVAMDVFPRIMRLRDADHRWGQILRREFWLRDYNAYRADPLIKRMMEGDPESPVCYEEERRRPTLSCFSILDAWYCCRDCRSQRAMVKRTVHDAICPSCHGWME